MQLLPSRNQWRNWSLPSKLTALGAYIGIMGILLTVAIFAIETYREERVSSAAQNDSTAKWALVRLSAALRGLRSSGAGGRIALATCRGDLARAGKVSDANLKFLVRTLEENSVATKEFCARFEEFEAFGEPAVDQRRVALCFGDVEASSSKARALSDRMQPRLKHLAANLSTETADEAAFQLMQASGEYFDHQELIAKAVDDCVFADLLTH
jgi:hypothetical protein